MISVTRFSSKDRDHALTFVFCEPENMTSRGKLQNKIERVVKF